VYRFLATPKWIGFAALMITLCAVQIGLGDWQLHRYHERHGINLRIAAAKITAPVPLTSVLSVAHPLPSSEEWVRVTTTGTYAPDKTIIARERTVNDTIGFEIVTPLILADGSAVLVDRGFIAGDDASDIMPKIPAVPSGLVTVSGRVHLPESEPDKPIHLSGHLAVRRISPATVAPDLGYPSLYQDYVLLDQQTPKAGGFTKIPADTQPAWMNAGYTVQWWCFAGLALIGFGWAARKEARDRRDGVVRATVDRPGKSRSRDRLADDRPTRLPEDREPLPVPAAATPHSTV
jgi:cytochrome oxidase assembly protein ShyY1